MFGLLDITCDIKDTRVSVHIDSWSGFWIHALDYTRSGLPVMKFDVYQCMIQCMLFKRQSLVFISNTTFDIHDDKTRLKYLIIKKQYPCHYKIRDIFYNQKGLARVSWSASYRSAKTL